MSFRALARPFAALLLLLPLVILLPATADAQSTCRGQAVTINMNTNGGNGNGTAGNDVILGTSGSETIRGYGGVDTICAGGGNDIIYGDGGSDRIRGEGGNDQIYAGSGADDVWGGPGNDTIYGHGGQDDIWGEDGDDYIQGNHQSDKLYGGNGNDTVAGADGKDLVYGDAGNDTLRGGNNSDQLFGGPGVDNLNGQAGSDTLTGGPGNDTCVNGTPVDCAEVPPLDTTAPHWTSPTLELSMLSRFWFTIDWGVTNDATAQFEVDIIGNGHYVKKVYQPYEHQGTIDTFDVPWTAGDVFTVQVSAIDNAGNRSEWIEIDVPIPAITQPMEGSSQAEPEPDGAAAAPAGRRSSKFASPSDVCGTFVSEVSIEVPIPERYDVINSLPVIGDLLTAGHQEAKTLTCHNGTNVTFNGTERHDCSSSIVSVFVATSTEQIGSPGASMTSNLYQCNIQGTLTISAEPLGVGASTPLVIARTMNIRHRPWWNAGAAFPLWVNWITWTE